MFLLLCYCLLLFFLLFPPTWAGAGHGPVCFIILFLVCFRFFFVILFVFVCFICFSLLFIIIDLFILLLFTLFNYIYIHIFHTYI